MTTDGSVHDGRVVRILTDKGFGFIREDATQVEYFFHMSAVEGGQAAWRALREGHVVQFNLGDSPKGPRAEAVRGQVIAGA